MIEEKEHRSEGTLAKLFMLWIDNRIGSGQLLKLPIVENMRTRFNVIAENKPLLFGILRPQTKTQQELQKSEVKIEQPKPKPKEEPKVYTGIKTFG